MCLNYLEHVRKNGFTPGLLTPLGIDTRLKHIKPFLAQGCYLASINLRDFHWILPYWARLKKSVQYRERIYFDKKRKLACWYDGMESGADNNVALLDYHHGTVISCDLNTFLYREYLALSQIARRIGFIKEEKIFLHKAKNIKKAIMRYLWDGKDEVFYNIDSTTGDYIKRVGYSSIMPLWGGIASRSHAKKMIRKYVLNPRKLFAKFGIRTLSKDDTAYNQKNIIKPYSNWQGPVWPLVNYFTAHALLHYGFSREAQLLAEKTVRLCIADIKRTKGMHENYDADTGKPLAAPQFISWNLLLCKILDEVRQKINPMNIE